MATAQPTTLGHVPAEACPWDLNRLPLAADRAATVDALGVLDEADTGRRKTVHRVQQVLVGDAPTEAADATDWVSVLEHTEGDLVALTWGQTGLTEIAFDPESRRFVVAGFTVLDETQPEFAETCSRARAKDMLRGQSPRAVTLEEASLLGGDGE